MISGFEDELDFWSATLTSDADVGEEHRRRLEVRELEPWLQELVPQSVDPVRILDVGSGPLTTLGSRLPGRTLEIVAVDPLADAYNELLDGLGFEPPVRPVPGRVEELAGVFPRDHFDLVHAANSLDHCVDPITGVEQMLAVLKPGGTLWLLHLKDVADAHQYEGLHQWSLRPADGDDMEIWNRDRSVRLSEIAGNNPFSVFDRGEIFVVRVTKTPR